MWLIIFYPHIILSTISSLILGALGGQINVTNAGEDDDAGKSDER